MQSGTTSDRKIFASPQPFRIGLWGLGRGMQFQNIFKVFNIDIVAGCDYNENMRRNFLENNPAAFVTADAEEFLKEDFDAVLLATFCPAHADDSIRCLKAGKHVLSEVTAFHTMAEGVRLVEAVETSGKVYNMIANQPFTKTNMYLADKWKEGLFGDLMYAEYEYVSECRSLIYTNVDGRPVEPGNTVHNWRSWLNFHYYCAHSIGPVMLITGTRPVRVVALPGKQSLAGYPTSAAEGMGGIAPSLINMSNGAVMRNLAGSTTNETRHQRIWGTAGSLEIEGYDNIRLRLGGSGYSPKYAVKASWGKWGETGELAERLVHRGRDFWIIYYFMRQVLTGERAPFDIYSACDVTAAGILAYRSSLENGKPYDVPDFRNRKERDAWRNDNQAQKRFDARNGLFPANADFRISGRFTSVMKDLITASTRCRSFLDWEKIKDDITPFGSLVKPGCPGAFWDWSDSEPTKFSLQEKEFAEKFQDMTGTYAEARKIADAYPGSIAAKVLSEMLELGYEKLVMSPEFQKKYITEKKEKIL